MHTRAVVTVWLGIAAAFSSGAAQATGVAGDRLFPSTLTIEDTQNDDELALPTVTLLRRGANGDTPAGRVFGIGGEFSRRLTEDLAASVGTGWRRRGLAGAPRSGWDNLDLGL